MGILDLYGNTPGMPMRDVPDKFKSSRLRGQIVLNDEPTEAYYPAKFLPIAFQDVSTNDGVVLTKGTIVSAIGPFSSGTSIPTPSASGTVPVFENQVSASTQLVNIDDSFWGYPDGIAGLIVPANGGTSVSYTYTALDEQLGTYKMDKTLASAGDTMPLTANRPIGILYNDVYADTRGKYLNYYSAFGAVNGIIRNAYIAIPFVNTTLFDAAYTNNFSTSNVYDKLYPVYSFLYATTANLEVGALLKADTRGKFIVEDVSTSANKTIQTVGRLHVLDNRFPKDMLEYVDTYPQSNVTGTDTGGIPAGLFVFAYMAIKYGSGSDPKISDVVANVRNGTFGMARIMISL